MKYPKKLTVRVRVKSYAEHFTEKYVAQHQYYYKINNWTVTPINTTNI